jgi:hypothetical protein
MVITTEEPRNKQVVFMGLSGFEAESLAILENRKVAGTMSGGGYATSLGLGPIPATPVTVTEQVVMS